MRVSGTPKFRINGVVVDGAAEMKSWQLVSLIESLFWWIELRVWYDLYRK
jgi:hypothetical protein